MTGYVLSCSTPRRDETIRISIYYPRCPLSGFLNEKELTSERAAQDEYDRSIPVRELVQRGKCQQV
jgi:hypothetical protein